MTLDWDPWDPSSRDPRDSTIQEGSWEHGGSSRQQMDEGSEENEEEDPEEDEENEEDELDNLYDRGPDFQSEYATGEDLTDEEADLFESEDLDGDGMAAHTNITVNPNHQYYLTGRTNTYHPVEQFLDVSEYRNSIPQPSQPHRSGPLAKGKIFLSKEQLIQACSDYSIHLNVQHKTKVSTPHKYILICKEYGCKWRLYARTEREGTFWKIIKNEKDHTCVRRAGDFTHDNLTAEVIANCIRNAVKRDVGISLEDIKSILEKEYPNVKPTYNKIWRGREKAIEHLFGSWEDSYNKLPSLLLAIQQTTPGTQIKWLFKHAGDPNRAMFESVAWAFGPCIAAVPYIRPVISIDASFLAGRYKGKLLAACGYDPEQRLVPLAFALVRTEDEACWGWFMKFLREQVVGQRKFCVVSDRHWGIRNMFKRPQYGWQESADPSFAVHRYCMQHVCENVFTASGKDEGIPHIFRNKLANKKKRRPFKKMWDELRVTHPQVIAYLKKCGKEHEADDNEPWRPERWAQTFDTGARWGLMTSNGSESLNSRYKAERRLPVVGLVEGTWYKSVRWFNERKQIALQRQADGQRWPKEVQLKIMKHTIKAAPMTVITIDVERGEFEVHVPYEQEFPGITWKYKVLIQRDYQPEDPQLPSRRVTCECKKPQLTGIPCAHVVAVCGAYRWEVDDFVDELYSTENMLKIWSSSDFHCYGDEENWPRYGGPVVFPDRNLINRGKRKKDRDWMWMDAMKKKKNKTTRTRRNNNPQQPMSMEELQSGRRTNTRRRTTARNRPPPRTENRGEASSSRDAIQPGRSSISIDPRTDIRIGLAREETEPRRNSISVDPRSASVRYPTSEGPSRAQTGIRGGILRLGARIFSRGRRN